MILSRGRGYLFVHAPKTGGTALALALEARAMKDDLLVGDTPKALRRRGRLRGLRPAGRLWKHSTLADLDGIVSASDLDRLLIVTLTRNPWDRVVSLWAWARAQGFDHPSVALARALPFGDFVRHPHTQATLAGNPLSRHLTDAAGRERSALVLRLEHLGQDLQPLAEHLGFMPEITRANVSARERDWRPYYDADTAALVGRLCAPDVARSGYGFDDYAAFAARP